MLKDYASTIAVRALFRQAVMTGRGLTFFVRGRCVVHLDPVQL
jgi:hypothetical protein